MRHEAERRALVEAAREVERLGLSPGTTGNLSVRVRGGFLVTPSGMPYGELDAADTVLLPLPGAQAPGAPGPTGGPGRGGSRERRRPSTEAPLHAAIYVDRPDAGAIVHLHSPHATAIACLRRDIPAFHYMVALAGGDSIRCARYATFGTDELALAAVEALEDRTACLLANHGQVALGRTLEDAVRLAREVEELATTYGIALEAGEPALLPTDEIERVRRRFRDYGQPGGHAAEAAGAPVRRPPCGPPVLRTERLRLRAFEPGDAPRIRELAGAPEIAAQTLNVPHPYPEGAAEAWIADQGPAFRAGEGVVFAVTEVDGTLIGAVGLRVDLLGGIAELGYWIGVPWWGRGYATEAARAVIDFGFRALSLQRIWARVFVRNPASVRVVEKAGLRHEGTLRKGLRKGEELLDHHVHAILREEWCDPRGERERKETR